ncbi:hypothetical protein [Parasphingorhabdus sp.]|uniref:hypothetical protein n=1 Tax=Parasphingorhabdus sp. TaxID=2709688 RepID=UPI003267E3DB
MTEPLHTQRDAAIALLTDGGKLTRKAGSFLGQLVAAETPMTERQSNWLNKLLEKADLPQLQENKHDR